MARNHRLLAVRAHLLERAGETATPWPPTGPPPG
jgi:hypothetical protein